MDIPGLRRYYGLHLSNPIILVIMKRSNKFALTGIWCNVKGEYAMTKMKV